MKVEENETRANFQFSLINNLKLTGDFCVVSK